MPTLKNPYSKGAAARSGFASGIQDMMNMLIKSRLTHRNQEDEDARIGERQVRLKRQESQDARLKDAETGVRAGGRISDYGSDIAPILNMRLGSTGQKSDAERLAPAMGSVTQDTTNSQIQAMLDKAGVDSSPSFGQMPQRGSPDALESTQFGPVAAKPYQDMLTARGQAGDSAAAKVERDLDADYNKSYGDTAAKGQAAEDVEAENFDASNTRKGVDAFTTSYNSGLGANDPTVGALKANNAGLERGATLDAENDPTRQAAHARGAGLNAGAEAAAKQPYEMARMREEKALALAGMKETEKWKLDNTITSPTRTMMEGAKMMLPRIVDVAKEAHAIDKNGQFGPIMSRVRQLATTAGSIEQLEAAITSDPEFKSDPLVGKFATELGLMASGIARVHGGARGGGSPAMLAYMKGLLSDSSTLDMFLGRLAGATSYMEDYAAGPNAEPKSHFNPDDYATNPGTTIAPDKRFMERP